MDKDINNLLPVLKMILKEMKVYLELREVFNINL